MRKVLSAVFVASVFAVGTAAQEQQPTAPAGQPSSAQAKTVISGCVQTSSAAPSSAGGAAQAAARYELTGAKAASGSTASTGAAARYRLDGDEKTLSQHVDHRVEITGSVTPASSGAGAEPVLKVESVKMIAASC